MISAGSAVSDSSTAPSTDCSASRFCGGAAADAVEQAALLEVLDERERVDRFADGVEVEHGLEDQAVRLAVEVLGLEALVDDQRRERGVRQQHGAEHGLLGFEVLGRRGCGASVAVGDGHRGGRY